MNADQLEQNIPENVKAFVKMWQRRIEDAKRHFDGDFKRMRENMKFVSGLQWDGQKKVDGQEYVANITLRQIRFKVSQLYAKNPTVEAKRRKRLDYQLWDGSALSLQQALMRAQEATMMGMRDLYSEAILSDYMHGRQMQQMIDKVCRTLEIVYQYQVDASKPEFKEQMKQLVTRVVTTGVGYVRLSFVREGEPMLSTVETPHSQADMLRAGVQLAEASQEGETTGDAALADEQTMRSLAVGIGTLPPQFGELPERLEFDFPPSTSIIVDPRCRALKEFVGARWVCQEYILPIEEVNAMFGVQLTPGGQLKEYQNGQPQEGAVADSRNATSGNDTESGLKKTKIAVWNVLNYQTRESFYIADGYCGFLREPQPLMPQVSGFWPIFALTTNDIEVECESGASIYPPSDVDLVKHAQKEWNRTREALRDQRNANAPTYLARKGVLTEADKNALRSRQPNQLIELEGIPLDMEPKNAISVMQVAAIDDKVYNTAPLVQDMQMAGGMQEANVGAAQPDVTATVGTIAEQSRVSVVDSNVDDFDCFLSRIAQAGGELILQSFSPEIVHLIAGDGAVFPDMDRQMYLNQIFLTIKAGSNGKPNKALRLNAYERVGNVLSSVGVNPLGMIEQGLELLDLDTEIEIDKFLPDVASLGSAMPVPGSMQGQAAQRGMPKPNASAPPKQLPGVI